MKSRILLITAVVLVFSCSSDDDGKASLYTRDWVVDARDYIEPSSDVPTASYTFTSSTLSNNRLLVSGAHAGMSGILEIDWQNGNVLYEGQDGFGNDNIWDLSLRSDGSTLAIESFGGGYHLGAYNATSHKPEYTATIPCSGIIGADINIPASGNYCYLVEGNIPVWKISKWTLQGEKQWSRTIDQTGEWDSFELTPSAQYSIASLAVFDDRLWAIIDVSTFEQSVAQLQNVSQDGNIRSEKKFGPVTLRGFQNLVNLKEGATGGMYYINQGYVNKLDKDSNEQWKVSITAPTGNRGLRSTMEPTADGGVLCMYHQKDIMLVKLDASGQVVWRDQYWEKDHDIFGLYELPSGNFIVTSGKGYITCYKLNK
jgi:hypothetical protein